MCPTDPNPAPGRTLVGMRHAALVLAAALALAGCGGNGDEPASGPADALPVDADWTTRIAERAGFAVTGNTESALIVEGRGPSFYLWSTPLAKPVAELAEEEAWQPLGRSADADVYGDGELWQWWVVQDRIVWVNAGPMASDRVPTLAELAPLIRASREVAAPRTR